jgi:hydroxyethylthiazole kinase-like uncharacterized protein yjeF
MKVVSPTEMKEIDRKAIFDVGIPGCVLMENAGRGIVQIIKDKFKELDNLKVAIVCGRGNNGGDGFVIARWLKNQGAEPHIFLLGNKEDVKGDAKTNLDIILKMGFKIREIKKSKDIPKFNQFDLLVDAIFGTGFKGSVEGIPKEVIDSMNNAGIPILAVDVPSGLDASNGGVEGSCIKAAFTCTMALPKRGLLLYPGREYTGELHVIDISVPRELYGEINLELLESTEMRLLLPKRPPDGHKGSFGRIFMLAGSVGMTGAACLSSMAALRIGAGLVFLGIPESLNSILEEKVTEVITKPLPETESKTFGLAAFDLICDEFSESDVLVMGPGLGRHEETAGLIRKILPKISVPTIIDADGINNLTLDDLKAVKGPIMITPHPGELSRLMGRSVKEIQRDRIEAAKSTAKELGLPVVLKGASTIIAVPDGKTYINPTGNSGLATAGSGDVLTGIIAGLLAQGLSLADAARLGVYIHGLAGDIAADKKTEYGMIASDVLEAIPEAIVALNEDRCNRYNML